MPRIWNVLQQRAERRRIREQYEQILLDQKEYPLSCSNNNNNNNANTGDDETEFTVQFIKPQQQQQMKKQDGAKSNNDSVVHTMEGKKSTLLLSQPHDQNRRLEDERKVIDDVDLTYNDESSHQESTNPVVRNILDDLSHTEEAINSIISYDDEVEGNHNTITDTKLVSEEEDVKVCVIVSPRAVVDEIFDGILEEDDCIDNGKESNAMGSSDNSNEYSKTLNTSLETLDPILNLSEDENENEDEDEDEDEDEGEGDNDQIDGLIDSFRCIHQHNLHHNHNCYSDLQIDTIEGAAYEVEGKDDSDDDDDQLDGPDSLHSIQQHHRAHIHFRDLQSDIVEGASYEEEEGNNNKTKAVIGNKDIEKVFALVVQQPPRVAIDEIFEGIEEVIDRVEHVKELNGIGSVEDNEWSKISNTSPEIIDSIPSMLFTIELGSYEEDGSQKEEENSSIPKNNSELNDCDFGEAVYYPDTILDNQEWRSYDFEEEEEEEEAAAEIYFAGFGSEYTTADDEQIKTMIYEHAKFLPSVLGTKAFKYSIQTPCRPPGIIVCFNFVSRTFGISIRYLMSNIHVTKTP